MSFDPVIRALSLPLEALVEQRVPKKLLLEQGAATIADKRQIQDGIGEMNWIAALKSANIGVQEYRDGDREYLEIAVIAVSLRTSAKATRLIELIHRAIPYPVVLISEQGAMVSISLAHKRFSQAEGGKVVVEEVRRTAPFHSNEPTAEETSFLASLALSSLPARDLFALYQGWIDRIAALEAAQITGSFTPPDSPARASTLREGLDTYARLRRDIVALRAQVEKEKQVKRRVELNIEIKRIEAQMLEIRRGLVDGENP